MVPTFRWLPVLLGSVALLAGCGSDSSTSSPPPTSVSTVPGVPASVPRQSDFTQVRRGGALFARHCASCHGGSAGGAPNWRHRGVDGMFPPPPLNGTGHAWHHPRAMLHEVIRNGSPPGQGNMPAWRDRLTDSQIDDIIAWFQSKWPDEVYNAWYQMDQRSRQ